MATPWELSRDMFLSESEVNSLLGSLKQHVDQAARNASSWQFATAATDQLIVQCLVFSGLRNSELCGLRVVDTIVGTRESVLKVQGTPRQDRTVYVPSFVSASIVQYVDGVRPVVVADGDDPADPLQPLVLNRRGRPYERTGLYRRVVRILSSAGFSKRASVQLLRHTYGYLGYKRSGGNLLFLQRQMGHAHPMVTSVYAEFVDEHYARLADVVGGVVAGGRGRPSAGLAIAARDAKGVAK